MATKTTYAESIIPYSGNTITLNGIEISNVSPTNGQILVATSSTSAEWQDPTFVNNTNEFLVNTTISSLPNARELNGINGILKSTPVGQVVLDLSNTSVVPNTYSNPEITVDNYGRINFITNSNLTESKAMVRIATTQARTLASDFEAGDTIDGVLLVAGNRILIKNQTNGVENGIYVVNSSGPPTRADDLPAGMGNIASGILIPVNEGTVNANQVFVCTNSPTSSEPGTDALTFVQLWGSDNTAIEVASSTELINAINSGTYRSIILGPGIYTLSSGITLSGSNPIHLKGYGFSSQINFNASTGTLFTLNSGNGGFYFENLSFNLSSANSRLFNIPSGLTDLKIRECIFTGRGFLQSVGTLSDCEIDSCILDCSSSGTSIPLDFGTVQNLVLQNSVIICNSTHLGLRILGSTSENCRLSQINFNGTKVQISQITSGMIIDSCHFNESILDIDSNASNILVINNKFSGSNFSGQTYSLQLSNCSNIKVSGNVFSQNPLTNHITTSSASGLTLRGNSFSGNLSESIALGDNSGHSLIEGCSSANGNLISLTSTGNTLVNVGGNDNNVIVDDPTSISPYQDSVKINKTTDPLPTITLANPTKGSAERTLYLLANSDTSGGGIPLYSISYTGTTFTNIEFQSVNDYVILQWTGSAWKTLESHSNVTFT